MTVQRPRFNQDSPSSSENALGRRMLIVLAVALIACVVWMAPTTLADDAAPVAAEEVAVAEVTEAEPAVEKAAVEADATETPASAEEAEDEKEVPAEEKAEQPNSEQPKTEDDSKEEVKPAEEEASTPAKEEVAAVSKAAGPAAKTFDETFTRWKELLKTLRDLKAEYTVAEKADLPALRDQWKQRIADGETLQAELNAAALAAYDEAPNEDRELVRYLITVAAEQIRTDNYPQANELLGTLMASGCDEKVVPDLAGIASFCTNDFEAAQAHFAKAAENKALSREGTRYKGDVENCQKKWAVESKLREAEAAADDLPRVKFETTSGDIVIELFENEAPETVGNFISLIEKGYYDGLSFHRVLDAFMAQGGCPKGDGSGGPGYNIYCECVNDNHRKHFAGSLSMAKQSAVNTGGSQFFITFVPTTSLDGMHTVFGRVLEGMDNAIRITRIDPSNQEAKAIKPTMIKKASVIRKREHEYRPNKVKS